MQTALLGILEVIVSIVLAIVFLGEQLTAVQWLGALIILLSILLVRYERNMPNFVDWWRLFWRFRIGKR
jgi:drug/metabolite transporter (DMT)-like permease